MFLFSPPLHLFIFTKLLNVKPRRCEKIYFIQAMLIIDFDEGLNFFLCEIIRIINNLKWKSYFVVKNIFSSHQKFDFETFMMRN